MLRPPTEADTDALYELINTIYRSDGRPQVVSRDEVTEYLTDEENPAATDVRVVDAPDGDGLIAWGMVHHSHAGERLERAFLDGGVHPDHRRQGIGTVVLDWLERRGTERLAATPDHLEAVLRLERLDNETDREPLFARAGFHDARYFEELERPLADIPPEPHVDGIDIVAWSPAIDAASCHLYNAAFADHWGSTPRAVESWKIAPLQAVGTRLDLSFAAIDPTVDELGGAVAYCLNSHYPDDLAVTGHLDGWIESLGTLRSHRGRGIASALIIHSLHAFARAGFDRAMIGVDTENLSGAHALYRSLGFRRAALGVSALKTVRHAADA